VGTIWLVGMMGAGKSAVGARLAERLGRSFVDTDLAIERTAGLSISELFAREGESAFRKREREAIENLAGDPLVVALGGGAMAQPGAPERLLESGTIVYLRTRPETLFGRLGEVVDRPLLQGVSGSERLRRIAELLAERSASYERASIVVDTDSLEPNEVAEAILCRLRDSL
jgi:shikimate kinase